MMTVVELCIGADPAAWRAVGFDVDVTGCLQLGGVRLRIDATAPGGLASWVLSSDDAGPDDIDGLATSWAAVTSGSAPRHANGINGIDHVVINTNDLERTCSAIEAATAAPLKRIREVGAMRQGFHRLGEVIIEIVTHPGVEQSAATFWGLALNAVDLDVMFAEYGLGVMSAPKSAVQPGRRISSFKIEAGLGLPVAIMSEGQR